MKSPASDSEKLPDSQRLLNPINGVHPLSPSSLFLAQLSMQKNFNVAGIGVIWELLIAKKNLRESGSSLGCIKVGV